MTKIRRINIYAGPGCGKSTLAARLFSALKVKGYDVEHIPEYIKTWAHEGRHPVSYDQLYVFAKQLKAEDVILRNVELIVTDSPILMNVAYSYHRKKTLGEQERFAGWPNLLDLSNQFDTHFPAVNLYIERTVEYVAKGRYQADVSEAIEFDEFLLAFLGAQLQKLMHVKLTKPDGSENFDSVLNTVEEELKVGSAS